MQNYLRKEIIPVENNNNEFGTAAISQKNFAKKT
jgi:hypothetical protein